MYNVNNLTVNDLIGLDYERLRKPITPMRDSGIGTLPQQNFYTLYPQQDQNQGLIPNQGISQIYPQLNQNNIIPLSQTEANIDLSNLINRGVANEPDVEQVKYLTGPSGIEKLMSYLPFGENSISGRLIRALPQESPEIRSMKNFYRDQYGLTPTGQVASGIMAGYNPVYGGALNMLTGGRFGTPTQFGLANAARQRIENIAKRRAPQTDASRAKIQELQRFAEADTISRARQAAPDVYRDAGDKGTLGRGGGFSTSGREGAFSSKSGRGRQDF